MRYLLCLLALLALFLASSVRADDWPPEGCFAVPGESSVWECIGATFGGHILLAPTQDGTLRFPDLHSATNLNFILAGGRLQFPILVDMHDSDIATLAVSFLAQRQRYVDMSNVRTMTNVYLRAEGGEFDLTALELFSGRYIDAGRWHFPATLHVNLQDPPRFENAELISTGQLRFDGPVIIGGGSTLRGFEGLFHGTFLVDRGKVSPGLVGQDTIIGPLWISGELNLLSNATFEVHVNTPGTPGYNFDLLTVYGHVRLGGLLDVIDPDTSPWSVYKPQAEHRMPFLTFDSREGVFDSVRQPADWNMSVVYTDHSVELWGSDELPGDMNSDHTVDDADLALFASAFAGQSGGNGDFNGDGVVSLRDLLILRSHLGFRMVTSAPAEVSPNAAVPEPATWAILWPGLLIAWRTRRLVRCYL